MDIAAVEKQTGLSKDTLRIWERRYGFPAPLRDDNGERDYPDEQIERLLLIRRLLDAGRRPAAVVGLALSDLQQEIAALAAPAEPDPHVGRLLELIQAHRQQDLRVALHRELYARGMTAFLDEVVVPLNHWVGEAWLKGSLQVFEEHLYSDQLVQLLRDANQRLRDDWGTPRTLLTTLPGEEHSLGILMAESTLSLHGANAVLLGVQTPPQDVQRAATAHKSDVVVLSFSSAQSLTAVKTGLEQVRALLPASVALWVGGEGVARVRRLPEGVERMGPLSELALAVQAWRRAHGLT